MLQGDISPAGDSEAIGRVEQIVERLQLNILQVMHDTEHVNSGNNLDILLLMSWNPQSGEATNQTPFVEEQIEGSRSSMYSRYDAGRGKNCVDSSKIHAPEQPA